MILDKCIECKKDNKDNKKYCDFCGQYLKIDEVSINKKFWIVSTLVIILVSSVFIINNQINKNNDNNNKVKSISTINKEENVEERQFEKEVEEKNRVEENIEFSPENVEKYVGNIFKETEAILEPIENLKQGFSMNYYSKNIANNAMDDMNNINMRNAFAVSLIKNYLPENKKWLDKAENNFNRIKNMKKKLFVLTLQELFFIKGENIEVSINEKKNTLKVNYILMNDALVFKFVHKDNLVKTGFDLDFNRIIFTNGHDYSVSYKNEKKNK